MERKQTEKKTDIESSAEMKNMSSDTPQTNDIIEQMVSEALVECSTDINNLMQLIAKWQEEEERSKSVEGSGSSTSSVQEKVDNYLDEFFAQWRSAEQSYKGMDSEMSSPSEGHHVIITKKSMPEPSRQDTSSETSLEPKEIQSNLTEEKSGLVSASPRKTYREIISKCKRKPKLLKKMTSGIHHVRGSLGNLKNMLSWNKSQNSIETDLPKDSTTEYSNSESRDASESSDQSDVPVKLLYTTGKRGFKSEGFTCVFTTILQTGTYKYGKHNEEESAITEEHSITDMDSKPGPSRQLWFTEAPVAHKKTADELHCSKSSNGSFTDTTVAEERATLIHSAWKSIPPLSLPPPAIKDSNLDQLGSKTLSQSTANVGELIQEISTSKEELRSKLLEGSESSAIIHDQKALENYLEQLYAQWEVSLKQNYEGMDSEMTSTLDKHKVTITKESKQGKLSVKNVEHKESEDNLTEGTSSTVSCSPGEYKTRGKKPKGKRKPKFLEKVMNGIRRVKGHLQNVLSRSKDQQSTETDLPKDSTSESRDASDQTVVSVTLARNADKEGFKPEDSENGSFMILPISSSQSETLHDLCNTKSIPAIAAKKDQQPAERDLNQDAQRKSSNSASSKESSKLGFVTGLKSSFKNIIEQYFVGTEHSTASSTESSVNIPETFEDLNKCLSVLNIKVDVIKILEEQLTVAGEAVAEALSLVENVLASKPS